MASVYRAPPVSESAPQQPCTATELGEQRCTAAGLALRTSLLKPQTPTATAALKQFWGAQHRYKSGASRAYFL